MADEGPFEAGMSMRHLFSTFAILLMIAASQQVGALDIGLSLSQESEYTTNSGRTQRDEVEEWSHSPGATISASHDTPSLVVGVDYTLSRQYFQQDLNDDQNQATGTANLLWNALPERLEFNVNHSRTQSAIRAIDPTTPNNRQETSNTSAGPTLRFRTRGLDEFRLQYQYGLSSAEQTDTDSESHNTTASYQMVLSSANSVNLELINNQVQFEDPLVPDAEYNTAQLTWNRTARDITYALTGGYNVTKRTQDRDDVDGIIYNAEIDWQVGPATSISFNAARDIQDQSNALTSGVLEDELDFSVNSDLNEVFTSTRASINLVHQLSPRTSLDIGIARDEQDFEDVARDTESQSISLGLTRQLNRTMDLSLSLGYVTQDFADEDDESTDLDGDLNLSWNIGRRLSFDFGVSYGERDSDRDIDTRTFNVWSTSIRINYQAISLSR